MSHNLDCKELDDELLKQGKDTKKKLRRVNNNKRSQSSDKYKLQQRVESSDRLKVKVEEQKRSSSRGRKAAMQSMAVERPSKGFFGRPKTIPINLKYDRIV